LAGFALVIVAAAIVIAEGRIVHRQLDDELRDVPDLADAIANRGHHGSKHRDGRSVGASPTLS
ncbi:hypothetical protein OFC55_29280, partial [Escherichia coli]|nr:hypothetical protein [Escherichia coli]